MRGVTWATCPVSDYLWVVHKASVWETNVFYPFVSSETASSFIHLLVFLLYYTYKAVIIQNNEVKTRIKSHLSSIGSLILTWKTFSCRFLFILVSVQCFNLLLLLSLTIMSCSHLKQSLYTFIFKQKCGQPCCDSCVSIRLLRRDFLSQFKSFHPHLLNNLTTIHQPILKTYISCAISDQIILN